jgi:hypothetical protein
VLALAGHDLQTLGLRALVLDLEIAGHGLRADVQAIALTGLTIGENPQPVGASNWD